MEEIKYRFEEVNIRNIEESPINAQIMKDKDFKRLVENIKNDGCLTSAILIMEQENKNHVCISGHHRVRAALKAGLKTVPSLIINEVDESTRIRLQLAHNDIHGEPDINIVAILQEKLSLDDLKFVSEIDVDIKSIESFDVTDVEFYHTAICLLPENHERLKTLISEIDKNFEEKVLVNAEDYDLLKQALTLAFKKGFKTPGQAFRHFLENAINDMKSE